MSLYDRLTVAGISLQEDWSAQQSSGVLSIAGEESTPPWSRDQVQAAHHTVNALPGRAVPIVFTGKPHLSGFYRVGDASSELFEREGIVRVRWSATLERLGDGDDVEIESRLPLIARGTDHAGVSAVFWHAPAVGFTSYYTGSSTPAGTVTRESADGPVTVHTGLPVSVAPRWTVPVGSYLSGSVRLTVGGVQRVGVDVRPRHPFWQLDNGIVRLSGGDAGVFEVAAWDSLGWRSVKGWRPTVAGAALTTEPEVTVLRNEPEESAVRLSYPTTAGRVTLDLALRRGARFVTGVMRRHSAATLGIVRATAEGATSETGRLRATANDADGNRYVIGSARTFTADTTTGGISKASITFLDFFVGHAFNGGTAAVGDAPADLLGQYLGTAGERVTIVRR